MIIQLATTSFDTEPNDYWSGVKEEWITVSGRDKTIFTKEFDSIEQCWNECDRDSVILSETHIYKKEITPDYIDFCVKVYDGRNE